MQNNKTLSKIGSIVLALALWQFAAGLLAQNLLLPTPVKVIKKLFDLVLMPDFWGTVWFSFWRIAGGFLLAMVMGILLAVVSYRFSLVETLLWPYVTLTKAVPVASFIIISLVWLSSKELSIFISFLMVFPVIYFNILQGMKATDIKKLQMAQLFGVPWSKRLLYIYIPQIKPFLLSACSVSLGMAWKSGIAAEVIGIPDGSIGEMLYEAKVYLSTSELFAWTIVILLVSILFEKVFLKLLHLFFDRLEKL